MAVNLRFVTKDSEFRQYILAEMQKKESAILNVARRAINDFIRDTLSDMMNSPIIRQIIDGKRYRGEIGVPDIGVQLRRFLRMFLKHLEPEIQWFKNLSFEMKFRLKENVYDNMLADANASFVSINSRGNETEVEWLNWLLLAGTKKVVTGYQFLYYRGEQGRDKETGHFKSAIRKSIQNHSRTKYGLMVPGNGWSVPSQIAGTASDNIFTRVLDESINKFEKFLAQRMEQYFGG